MIPRLSKKKIVQLVIFKKCALFKSGETSNVTEQPRTHQEMEVLPLYWAIYFTSLPIGAGPWLTQCLV